LKLKSTSLLIAATLFGGAVMPAQANNDAMLDLLKVLRDKGTISAQDYDLLANAAAADKEMAEADKAEMKKEVADATANMPVIETDGKLVVSDRDGNWSFQPIGRVMWDAIDADADDFDDYSGDGDYNGTELRRTRLGFEGDIYDWSYKFEADFAGGGASIKDAYVGYGNSLTDTTKWGVKLGQSHIPFGLNTKISSKYMSFMDRPLFADSVISPARQSGGVVSVNDKDYKWLFSAGVSVGEFGDDNDFQDKDETTEDGSGTTFAMRGSFLPYQDDKNLVQLGAGYLNLSSRDEGFSFSQHLVAHPDHTSIRSGSIGEDEFDGADAFTVDAMAIFGSFHAMAEYLDYSAESKLANADIDFNGYAIEAGYFLTGESLKWKKGYTSGISPKSKYGAWQVAARFESLEIDNDAFSYDNEVDKFTVGINYYPTKNTRLMLNYDKVTSWDGQNGFETSGADSEPSALKFRAQAFW
jgi:phosphate-selective porin OprO/OprP